MRDLIDWFYIAVSLCLSSPALPSLYQSISRMGSCVFAGRTHTTTLRKDSNALYSSSPHSGSYMYVELYSESPSHRDRSYD